MYHRSIHKLLVATGLVGLLVGWASVTWAEPVTTIKRTGPARERIDIVILGDGYTRANLDAGDFERDAAVVVSKLFEEQPYQEYERLFNVRRIDVASRQPGADHPEKDIFKDTAFDATYHCAGIQRMICIDVTKVNDVLLRSIPAPIQRDFAVVIVNDSAPGGSGGTVSVTSTHPSMGEFVLHEMGHSLALLGDEYEHEDLCDKSTEPPWPNVTKTRERNRIKWLTWISPSTPTPTLTNTPDTPGLYPGGGYCAKGLYRSSYDSKMRTLGKPFEQINREEHIKRFYNFVSPLAKPRPNRKAVKIARGTNKKFSARVQRPKTRPVKVSWFLDGRRVSRGTFSKTGRYNRFLLETASLEPGRHTLRVVVKDPTPWVRIDPARVLRARHKWAVTITP